jgi:hypothetical protein
MPLSPLPGKWKSGVGARISVATPGQTEESTGGRAEKPNLTPFILFYLLHPLEMYLPGAAGWAVEVEALLREDQSWNDWDLIVIPYDAQNRFAVQPLFVRVLNKPGPVVLLESVQRKALESLRDRLRTKAVVMVQTVTDSGDLWVVLDEARRRFQLGEPFQDLGHAPFQALSYRKPMAARKLGDALGAPNEQVVRLVDHHQLGFYLSHEQYPHWRWQTYLSLLLYFIFENRAAARR